MAAGVYLCCDTATLVEAVALVRVGGEPGARPQVLAERQALRPRGHGSTVLETIAEVLAEAGLKPTEIDAFVVGLGPGSFTGLRISLATLKGLALATARPLHGVMSLEAFRAAHPGSPVLYLADARRGEVFAHGYGVEAPVSATPERLAGLLLEAGAGDALLLGPGAELYAERLRAALPGATLPDDPDAHRIRASRLVDGLATATRGDFAALEPCYVRPSDAEINYPDGFPDATVAPKQKAPTKRPREA
jgi:tRNA threonylcarbamoyladenosine biosynthesis protein TsaB